MRIQAQPPHGRKLSIGEELRKDLHVKDGHPSLLKLSLDFRLDEMGFGDTTVVPNLFAIEGRMSASYQDHIVPSIQRSAARGTNAEIALHAHDDDLGVFGD